MNAFNLSSEEAEAGWIVLNLRPDLHREFQPVRFTHEILSRKNKQTKNPIGTKVDLCESVVSGWLYFAKKPKAVLLFSILGPNEGREKQNSVCLFPLLKE